MLDNSTGSTTSTGTPSHIEARLVATLNKRAEQEGKQAGVDLVCAGGPGCHLITAKLIKIYSREAIFSFSLVPKGLLI